MPVPAPAGPAASAVAPAPAAVGRSLEPGSTLADGRYRVEAPLGRGGFGITYAAVDRRLRRPVAIKELFPEGARRVDGRVVVPAGVEDRFARARQRFLSEATTLARFGHPNIVRVFAAFEERETAYLVLERLDGRTLAAELLARGGPLTEAEGLDVAVQAAAALTAVHRAAILHRDVTPANLVRTSDGRLVLIDFGLARPFAEDRTTSMTRIATPGYAPPEQHRGSARFSARADVYALGATLYRLLSNRHPPPGHRRDGEELLPLWRVNPTVSRRTSEAVAAALSVDPADRPSSVEAWLERLGIPTDAGHDATSELADRPTVVADEPVVADDGGEGAAVGAALQWVVPAPDEPARGGRGPRGAGAVRAIEVAPQPRLGVAPPGRAWVTVPLGLALVSLASAQPITVVALAGLLAGPALATAGDAVARPTRSPAWVPAWLARNVAVGAVRALGPAVVLVTGLGLWYGADAFESVAPAAPWILRITGGIAGWLMAVSIGQGGSGFRSHLALDELAHRLAPDGRPTMPSVVLAIVCTVVVLAGVAFQPEAWPIR